MKREILIFLALFSAVSNAAPVVIQVFVPPQTPAPATSVLPKPPAPDSAVLRWNNGETLRGNIAAASADDLTWKTSFFADPLQLHWSVVDRIDWPTAPAPPSASFGIALRDGSFIYGDLVSITGDSIRIHSARHGDAQLKLSEVLSLRRLPHDHLLYSGPMGDQGWTAMTNQPDGSLTRNPPPQTLTPPLATGPDGSLLIQTWNRAASADIKLPDRFDVEFRVRSSIRPQFLLAFGGNIHDTLHVETWDDDLVLTVGDQFQVLRTISDNEREVALRILWDGKAQTCWAYTPAGELIATWQLPLASVPPAAPRISNDLKLRLNAALTFTFASHRGPNAGSPTPGVILQNRGLDLSLDFLRVREWDGKLPVKLDPKQPRVELADGRSVAGQVSSGAPGLLQVQGASQTPAAGFPIADVDALIFSSDPPQISSHDLTLCYNDGSTVHGKIASISDGRAAITTSFSRQPLSSQLDQLRRLISRTAPPQAAAAEPALASLDKLVVEQTTLHGKLSAAGDGSLRWLPVGGIRAVKLSKSLSSEITRSLPQNGVPASDPALFYLNTGDILPGSLQSIDPSGVDFQSSIMDARQLPAGDLHAIEFNPPVSLNVQGFTDPGWKIVKGNDKSVRRTDGGLQMDAGTSILHPALMQSSEIRFKMSAPNGLSSARLRMFCSEGDNGHSINLLLGCAGNQFIAGTETTNGQFDNQAQIMTKPGEPVSVALKIDDTKITVFANDVSLQEIPIEPAKYDGFGLLIEPAGIWGNNIFPVSLSDFSSHSLPGRSWLPAVSGEIKSQVLTVPRFEKNDPPRQVLLAANGDVLRGEIEAATDSHFGFRTGLETLSVPRDRVRAVIWLQPPTADTEAAPAAAIPSGPLEERIPMRIMFGGAGLNQYMSFLKSQVPDLKYKLPDNDDQGVVQMQIGNQTVGEALDAICSRFSLTYRLDGDGTIIFESQAQATTTDVASQSYWLKPAAFPDKPPAQDILAAKGITFSKDSSAQWQAKSGLLSMTNTPENQARLASLVQTDFGGSLGSPSYWLQLTSGGRLPLAVDKFGDDFITGHNPSYGALKVPMAQVYIIRTSAPEPTLSTKSLNDWRLVNAPEPVIPDGGGETSPLLGKEASTFTLPLLDGGEFDLAAQKGQIVVLDFWATWCGPCVRSLPGLIDALAPFPSSRVKLIGVNQGEPPAQVKHFLDTKGLKLAVAMDADQSIGRKYGVDAIPQTIIIGLDGKVAWTQTGYDPDGDTEAVATIKHLLEAAPAVDPPPKPATP